MTTLKHKQPSAIKYYDQNWQALFEPYESLGFQMVHRGFLRFLPSAGGLCLDIGAGTGRDAAALARRKYKVIAVEPSEKLRRLASETHQESNITWVNDKLPKLSAVKQMGKKFQFILLSAVWMHLKPTERLLAIKSLSELLAHNGFLAITLRYGPADTMREIYPVSTEELIELASSVGLKVVYKSRENKDSLKRAEIQWRKLVFSTA